MKSEDDNLLPSTEEKRTLKFYKKLAYGYGEFGIYIISAIQGFYLQQFLLEVAQIGAFEAGTIVLVAQIWDGINGPIIGRASDLTKTRWGRRRPYLFFGALPLALSWWGLWQVPSISPSLLTWYYLLFSLLISLCSTIVAVPYNAVTPDLSEDYDERTSLTMFRFMFGLLGALIGTFCHALLIEAFANPKYETDPDASPYDYVKGYLLSATVFFVPIVSSPLVTFFGIREKPVKKYEAMGFKSLFVSYIRGLKYTFTNKPFVLLLIVYFLSWVVVNTIQSNLILWIKYVMKKESEQAYILLTIQASASVFLFVFSPISKKFGKKITYVLGMSILICVTFSIFYIDEQVSPFIIYFLGFLAGMGVATGLLIPWSMLPDAVDLDQLRTGYRREGDMYAIFGLFQKIGLGGAIAASSYALGLAGYVSPGQQDGKYPDDQPESVILTLKLIIGPIPACFLLLSFIPLYFYPITKEKHQEILRQLNKVDEVSY